MTTKAHKKKTSSFTKFSETFNASLESYRKQVSGNSRLQLIDLLCVFLVVVGVAQFTFMCVLRDTFPFNAFLAGFISCVGQFVLLVSLRMQIVNSFPGISKERAFGEFIFASLIMHFICLHFVN